MTIGGARAYLVPPTAPRRNCTCGKLLAFVPSERSTSMPVSLEKAERREGRTYAPQHWRDCPDRQKHARKKGGRS